MRKVILLLLVTLCIAACDTKGFIIEGDVRSANDSNVVYLERLTLSSPELMDSARLRGGHFRFKANRPQYPDLYQVRIKKRAFIFPIDSTEHIRFEAHVDSLHAPTTVLGSRQAVQLQSLRSAVRQLQAEYNQTDDGYSVDSVVSHLQTFKDSTRCFILANPRSIVAYYALFQQLGGYYIFSPFNKPDRPYCAAVATAFNTFMPDYYRSKNLYALVMQAIGQERQQANEQLLNSYIDSVESGFLDIALPGRDGSVQRLSDRRGKVVLIDFSAYTNDDAGAYNLFLRDVYGRYHQRGFEIFQIAGDTDIAHWRQLAATLPWCSLPEISLRKE